MSDCVRPLSTRGKSVKDDWRAWLPEAKVLVFNRQVHQLEASYMMLSVSLDEAIKLRQMGQRGKSLQAVGITSGLCRLLTSTLQEIVEDLDKDFRRAVEHLADGLSSNPSKVWAEVDRDHYDLNTCLREAIVVFKSFLIALPESQLGAFQNTVRRQSESPEADVPSTQGMIRHRRMTAIAGE